MKILKHEEISPRGYRTMADVIAHLPHFLETIYNNNRQHSALLSVVQCLRGRSRPFPFIRSNHTLLIVQPRGSLHLGGEFQAITGRWPPTMAVRVTSLNVRAQGRQR